MIKVVLINSSHLTFLQKPLEMKKHFTPSFKFSKKSWQKAASRIIYLKQGYWLILSFSNSQAHLNFCLSKILDQCVLDDSVQFGELVQKNDPLKIRTSLLENHFLTITFTVLFCCISSADIKLLTFKKS